MTSVTDDSLVRRVRKLLDKAEGTTNPHEAEAFSTKAAALIARHRIDPDRLADVRAGGSLAVRSFHLGRGAYVRARLALLIAVADAHDIRVVFENGAEGMVAHAAGFDDDLEVTTVLYHSLHQQAALQLRDVRLSTAAATQRHRRAFLFGYANRIGQILAEANDAAVQASDGSADPGVELAVRARVARVDEFAAQTWGRVRSARQPRAAEAQGWDIGARAADGADVGRARIGGRVALPEGARAAS